MDKMEKARRLREDEGLSWPQIAERLGVSKSTARNWVKKAAERPQSERAVGLPAELAGLVRHGMPLTSQKVEALRCVLVGKVPLEGELAGEWDDWMVSDIRHIRQRMAAANVFDPAKLETFLAAAIRREPF